MSNTDQPAASGPDESSVPAPGLPQYDPSNQQLSPIAGHVAPQQVTHVTVVSPKSVGVAYVFLLFFGSLGIHKFYLDRVGMGLVYLGLSILGWVLTLVFVGWLVLAALWIMMIVDLFTLAGQVRRFNAARQPTVHQY